MLCEIAYRGRDGPEQWTKQSEGSVMLGTYKRILRISKSGRDGPTSLIG